MTFIVVVQYIVEQVNGGLCIAERVTLLHDDSTADACDGFLALGALLGAARSDTTASDISPGLSMTRVDSIMAAFSGVWASWLIEQTNQRKNEEK